MAMVEYDEDDVKFLVMENQRLRTENIELHTRVERLSGEVEALERTTRDLFLASFAKAASVEGGA